MLRILEVQMAHMQNLHAVAADVTIAPDVAVFPIDDFDSTDAMCERGEAAAMQAIPEIRRRLANLRDDSCE